MRLSDIIRRTARRYSNKSYIKLCNMHWNGFDFISFSQFYHNVPSNLMSRNLHDSMIKYGDEQILDGFVIVIIVETMMRTNHRISISVFHFSKLCDTFSFVKEAICFDANKQSKLKSFIAFQRERRRIEAINCMLFFFSWNFKLEKITVWSPYYGHKLWKNHTHLSGKLCETTLVQIWKKTNINF